MNLSKKEYTFKSGIKAVQHEATYKQDKKLIQMLVRSFNVNSLTELKDKMNIMQLIDKLMEADILLSVIDIILICELVPDDMKSEKYAADWENLTREEIITIATDFFILSPSLSKKLGIGKLLQDSPQE